MELTGNMVVTDTTVLIFEKEARGKSRMMLGECRQEIEPILSIAIPTYRRFGLLKETLDSAFSLDFAIPVEILVVDNDPEEDELPLREISSYADKKLVYYKNAENLGMFGNWNQCLGLAKGKYVTILHDDDLLLPEFAEQVNQFFGGDANKGDIFGFQVGWLDQRLARVTERGVRNPIFRALSDLKRIARSDVTEKGVVDFFFGNSFCGTLGVIMSREKAIAISGFDAQWYPIADYDFWCRWVSIYGPIPIVRKTVGMYRMQQNETMRAEIKAKFVSGSTLLRERMIQQGLLPVFFQSLIKIAAWMQKKSIDEDWRENGDATMPKRVKAALCIWRLFTYMAGRADCLARWVK